MEGKHSVALSDFTKESTRKNKEGYFKNYLQNPRQEGTFKNHPDHLLFLGKTPWDLIHLDF